MSCAISSCYFGFSYIWSSFFFFIFLILDSYILSFFGSFYQSLRILILSLRQITVRYKSPSISEFGDAGFWETVLPHRQKIGNGAKCCSACLSTQPRKTENIKGRPQLTLWMIFIYFFWLFCFSPLFLSFSFVKAQKQLCVWTSPSHRPTGLFGFICFFLLLSICRTSDFLTRYGIFLVFFKL